MLSGIVPLPTHNGTSKFQIVMRSSEWIKPSQSSSTARTAVQIPNRVVGAQADIATQVKLIRRRSAIVRRWPVHSIDGIVQKLPGLPERNRSEQLDADASAWQQ